MSRYVLATGDEGADRLAVVEGVHGEDTERLLTRVGLHPGMRVVDVGCGVGLVTMRMARLVAPDGEVVGVDISPEQVKAAEQRAQQEGIRNVRFVVAPADKTGLEPGTFDVAYARFLLMHVPRPMEVVREMVALLRRGGQLVLEDGDFTAPYCNPPSAAFDRCFELYREVIRRQGANPEIGPWLSVLAMEAGLVSLNVAVVQPVLKEGPAKRLPEWTLTEAMPAILEAGLATAEEITAIAEEMARLAADPTTEFGMAQMTQVWATKP